MINRDNKGWKGRWNGLGGRIEDGETPLQCAQRELFEESGIALSTMTCLAEVSWIINDDIDVMDGMYCFLGEIDNSMKIPTPIKTEEGVLDWKKIDWILDKYNTGIPDNIPSFLPSILAGKFIRVLCKYKNSCDILGEIIKLN